MKKLSRGHRLQKAAIDASRPIHVTAISKPELVEIQKSDGAYQKRATPRCCAIAARYCSAGRIPSGPIRPLI